MSQALQDAQRTSEMLEEQLASIAQRAEDAQRTSQTLEEKLAAITRKVEVAEAALSGDAYSSPEEVTQLKVPQKREWTKR